jgi:uncharacterized protein
MKTTYTDQFIKANKFDENSLFIKDNLLYETITGSHAYGCNNLESDYDIVGIFMDRLGDLYPQNFGYILGFDQQARYESKELKGDNKKIKLDNSKDCEGEWHSLTNFFMLAGIKGSPNLVETLFTRKNFVTFGSDIAWMLRDNRRLFLSARTFCAFKGYAFGQLSRIRNHFKTGKSDNPKRQHLMDKFHYDVKQSYHLLRLIDQLEQILTVNDIDLMRNKDECISMRNGEWGTFEQLEEHFNKRMLALEELVLKVSLPQQPQTGALHSLLEKCLEQFYGSESHLQKEKIEFISCKKLLDEIQGIKNDVQFIKSNTIIRNFGDGLGKIYGP